MYSCDDAVKDMPSNASQQGGWQVATLIAGLHLRVHLDLALGQFAY